MGDFGRNSFGNILVSCLLVLILLRNLNICQLFLFFKKHSENCLELLKTSLFVFNLF